MAKNKTASHRSGSRARTLGVVVGVIVPVTLLLAASPAPAVAVEDRSNGKIVLNRETPSTGAVHVFTVRADGRRVRRLTHGRYRDLSPQWSPDGSRIAFIRDHLRGSGDDELWVMRPNGSDKRKVHEARAIGSLEWSPDASRLVVGIWEGGDRELYVVDVCDGGVTQLTHTPDEDEWSPSWSPDGELIAYAAERSWDDVNVYVIRPDGSGRTALTDDGWSSAPEWSPDGRHIAFTSSRDDETMSDYGPLTEVYVMDRNGDAETRVSNIPASWESSLSWIGDDRLVWRAAYYDSRDTEIFVARIDGTGQTKLTDNAGFDEVSPEPSPDGRWIAFGRHKDGARRRSGVFKIRVDGSGETKLLPATRRYGAGSSLDWRPAR